MEVIFIIPVSESARKSVIDEIILTGHKVIVLGRVDTGKSTFCRQLAFHALQKGLRVAIVDSDVGQSWIGPPTTVGMKVVVEEFSSTLFPDAFYFVGNITPERYLLQTAVGAKRMVESAESAYADLIIADTTGWIDRPAGRALKLSKIDLIRPDHVVCFQRGSELEILIKGIELECCHIHRLEPSRYAERKSQEYRSKYRNDQFVRYFSDFTIQEFQFSQLRGQRNCFLNGRRANEKELDNISQILDAKVLYAELFSYGMFVITHNRLDWIAERRLSSQLKIHELTAKILDDYKNMLVALIDGKGEAICLGLIEYIDFSSGMIGIRCKVGVSDSVKAIQFSDFKLLMNFGEI
jgi:polynucleotide 5'-hydroxyl-kinase GRC3/NOL9